MLHRVTAALVMAAAASAVLGAPAHAGTSTTSPMVTKFVRLGVTFWADRGVRACPAPVVVRDSLDALHAGGGVPESGSCRVYLSDTLIRRAQRERYRPGRDGDSLREELCTTVFHELGHTAGLPHTETGLMSTIGAEVPGECSAWVARRERAERKRLRIRRAGGALQRG